MAKSAAEIFLDKKRKEEEARQRQIMALQKQQIGMANMQNAQSSARPSKDVPLMSGRFVGQQEELRTAYNGKPYIADKGEVLVTDANTVNAYGGPSQIDQFLQQNKPIPRFATGGVPSGDYSETKNPYMTVNVGGRKLAMQTPEQWQNFLTYQKGKGATGGGYFDTPDYKTNIINTPTGRMAFLNQADYNKYLSTMPADLQARAQGGDVARPTTTGTTPTPTTTPVSTLPQVTRPQLSQSEVSKMIADRTLGRMGAMQEGERSAEAQRMLQQGATQGEIAGAEAVSDVSRRSALGETAAQLGISEAQAAEQRAATQQAQALQTQQQAIQNQQWQTRFDEDKRQFTTTQEGANNWKAFETALEMGSDADVQAAYQKATGKTLDSKSLAEYREYYKTKRAQDITMGGLNIDTVRTQLGDADFNSVTNMINQGATYDQVKEKYPNITQGQFDSMSIDRNNKLQAVRTQLGDATFNSLVSRIQAKVPYDKVVKEFPKVTREQYNSMIAQYETGWEAAQLSLDTATYDSAVDAISKGALFDAAFQTKFPDITKDQYDSIRENGYLGERDYNRRMQLAEIGIDAAIKAKDWPKVAEIYADLGIGGIDMNRMITAQSAEDFAGNMATIATILSTNPTLNSTNWNTDPALRGQLIQAYKNSTGVDLSKAIDQYGNVASISTKDRIAGNAFNLWASNTLYGMELAADPVYTQVHSISDPTLTDILKTSGYIDIGDFEYPPGTEGKAAARLALTHLMITGGMKIDDDGNLTFDATNPALAAVGLHPQEVVSGAPVLTGTFTRDEFKNAEVNEMIPSGGLTYYRASNNGTDSDFVRVDRPNYFASSTGATDVALMRSDGSWYYPGENETINFAESVAIGSQVDANAKSTLLEVGVNMGSIPGGPDKVYKLVKYTFPSGFSVEGYGNSCYVWQDVKTGNRYLAAAPQVTTTGKRGGL